MTFLVCVLIACLALWMVSFEKQDFVDAHGKQAVFIKPNGEIIRWDLSPVLTFGGSGAEVILSRDCRESTVAVASIEAQTFYIKCVRACDGCLKIDRAGATLSLTADQPVALQDRDLLRFQLPELGEEQIFHFLVGNLSMAEIIQKIYRRQ